jgi:hypothetical protein
MGSKPQQLDPTTRRGNLIVSRRREQGQVLVIFALAIFALVGFAALAIDAGYLMAERRQAQAKADGAAMAADKAYQRNQIANIVPTGIQYATTGADSVDPAEVTVTPLATYSVNGIGYVKCVQVVIQHDVTPFFVGAVYGGAWEVSAEAVACTETEPREYALYALDDDGDGIQSSGTADVTITGGGAMSNATDDPGIDLCGSVNWDQDTGYLDSVEGIKTCNNANVTVPEERQNPAADSVADPLAGVAEPSCGAFTADETYTDTNVPAAERYPAANWKPDVRLNNSDLSFGTDQRFKPGNYPNGISVTKGFNVTFESGLYCIGGNGLELNTNSDVLNATDDGGGILLYFTGNNSSLAINGQHVNVNFSSPSSCGGYDYADACSAGILVFHARPSNCERFILNGNDVTLDGILYAPCSRIQLEGNGDLTINGAVIGGEIAVRGGNSVTINYDSSLISQPAQVRLVE